MSGYGCAMRILLAFTAGVAFGMWAQYEAMRGGEGERLQGHNCELRGHLVLEQREVLDLQAEYIRLLKGGQHGANEI